MPRCSHQSARLLFRKPESGPLRFDYLMFIRLDCGREGVQVCDDCGALFYQRGSRRRYVSEWRVEGLREDAVMWERRLRGDGDRRRADRLRALIERPGTEGEREAAKAALARLEARK